MHTYILHAHTPKIIPHKRGKPGFRGQMLPLHLPLLHGSSFFWINYYQKNGGEIILPQDAFHSCGNSEFRYIIIFWPCV